MLSSKGPKADLVSQCFVFIFTVNMSKTERFLKIHVARILKKDSKYNTWAFLKKKYEAAHQINSV